MKDFMFVVQCLLLTSCTLSIMLTDSHGTDNDVDSSPTQETKTDADIQVPASLLAQNSSNA